MNNPLVPEIQVVLVEDDDDVRHGTAQALELAGFTVLAFGSVEAARAVVRHDAPLVLLCDVNLPGQHATAWLPEVQAIDKDLPMILVTGHGDIAMAVQCMHQGAYDFIEKPAASERIVSIVQRAAEKRRLVLQVRTLGEKLASRRDIELVMVGRSAAMQALRRTVLALAATTADVLIYGETGTGKELVARCLHDFSPRQAGPFVPINCGGLPDTLVENELFGHEAGAFTGAQKARAGKIESAHGGTLFFDEVESMPAAVQVKLLRVLQERAVRPVGATRAQAVDLRIVSATHRDLDAALAAGQFRADLYYRIDVVSLQLPTLAERREDIPLLAGHFLRSLAHKYGRRLTGFAPEALEALATAPWPGNVRQLHNVVEQACALATTALIPRALVERALRVQPVEALGYAEAKRRFERNYLIQLLKLTAGNVSDAARLAERNRTEFYRLLQRHDLTPELFRGAGPDVEQ